MIEKLREKLGARVVENEPLAKYTNFRIGGPAKYFFEARTSDEIMRAVQAASELGIPFFVLGGGSNVLVRDKGFDGLIIKAANRNYRIEKSENPEAEQVRFGAGRNQKTAVYAEAGVLSAMLARKTAEAGLTGFEWAVSLPGTIGGAVRGNAGCFGGEMQDVVRSVKIFVPKQPISNSRELGIGLWEIRETGAEQCGFGYRDSAFKHMDPPPIVLSAALELKRDDPQACVARVEEKLRMRKDMQPLEASSAGCIFKNVEFQNEDELAKLREHIEVPEAFLAAKRIPAGWIIEQLGLKGLRIGDAQISEKHGNFVLNRGKATADEVVQLIALVKTRSRNELGIQLQEEVQYVGFRN